MKTNLLKKFVAVTSAAAMVVSMAITVSAAGENDNLALGVDAFGGSLSGATMGGVSGTMTDGTWNTTSGTYVDGAEAYYGIDFGEDTTINRLTFTTSDNNVKVVENIASRVTNAKVQYFNGEIWVDISLTAGGVETENYTEVTGKTGSSGELRRNYKSIFDFEAVTAQQFRVLVTDPSNTSTQCMEIEAYYITNPNIKGVAEKLGEFESDKDAEDNGITQATAFKVTFTNNGTADGAISKVGMIVTSGGESKNLGTQSVGTEAVTLAPSSKVVFGVIVEKLYDAEATATVTFN